MLTDLFQRFKETPMVTAFERSEAERAHEARVARRIALDAIAEEERATTTQSRAAEVELEAAVDRAAEALAVAHHALNAAQADRMATAGVFGSRRSAIEGELRASASPRLNDFRVTLERLINECSLAHSESAERRNQVTGVATRRTNAAAIQARVLAIRHALQVIGPWALDAATDQALDERFATLVKGLPSIDDSTVAAA